MPTRNLVIGALIAASALLASAHPAHAAFVLGEGFDSGTVINHDTYGYADVTDGYTNPAVSSTVGAPGNLVNALQVSVDSTLTAGSPYWGFGAEFQIFNNATIFPTMDARTYSFHFELLLAGNGANNVTIQPRLGLSTNNGNSVLVHFNAPNVTYSGAGGWQQFTVTFSNADVNQGSVADAFNQFASIDRVQVALNFDGVPFGYDAGNNVSIDNIALNQTAVPEPASLGLLALGGLALLRRRH